MPSKVPVFAKERIIAAFLSKDEDFLEIAKMLNMNSSTAYTIVARRYQAVQSHGGKRYQKFDDEMEEIALNILSENPLKMYEHTQREKPQVHIKTLANALDGLTYTLKQPRDVPADRNSADVINDLNERYEYAISDSICFQRY